MATLANPGVLASDYDNIDLFDNDELYIVADSKLRLFNNGVLATEVNASIFTPSNVDSNNISKILANTQTLLGFRK